MPRRCRAKLPLRLASGKGDAQPSRRTWPCGSCRSCGRRARAHSSLENPRSRFSTATTGRHHRTSSGRDPAGRFNSFGNRCRATLLLRRATRNRRTGVGRSFRPAAPGPVEAAGAVDAESAPTAPWKTQGQVFHSYHRASSSDIVWKTTQQGASTRSGTGVGRSFCFAWRRENAAQPSRRTWPCGSCRSCGRRERAHSSLENQEQVFHSYNRASSSDTVWKTPRKGPSTRSGPSCAITHVMPRLPSPGQFLLSYPARALS